MDLFVISRTRILELVSMENKDELPITGVESPKGPIWWCHLFARRHFTIELLSIVHILYPDTSIALRKESMLISEDMQHFRYEVPLLLLSGRSILISAQDVMAQLIYNISRCDDRLFRKSILYVADKIELKFVNRTINPSVKADVEIIELTNKAIRTKWLLHAREDIVLELLQHLHESTTKSLLDGVIKLTREILAELEVVHEHLFTLLRIWFEEEKVKINHNLGIFGGCGLVLSVITSLFGINVDGIPGSQNSPYAFTIFCGVVIVFGIFLLWFANLMFGYKKLITL